MAIGNRIFHLPIFRECTKRSWASVEMFAEAYLSGFSTVSLRQALAVTIIRTRKSLRFKVKLELLLKLNGFIFQPAESGLRGAKGRPATRPKRGKKLIPSLKLKLHKWRTDGRVKRGISCLDTYLNLKITVLVSGTTLPRRWIYFAFIYWGSWLAMNFAHFYQARYEFTLIWIAEGCGRAFFLIKHKL